LELDTLRQRNLVLTTAKDELQKQLEHYADKFAEFQDTLTKSNEVSMARRLLGYLNVILGPALASFWGTGCAVDGQTTGTAVYVVFLPLPCSRCPASLLPSFC
jgi:hypothetical protein